MLRQAYFETVYLPLRAYELLGDHEAVLDKLAGYGVLDEDKRSEAIDQLIRLGYVSQETARVTEKGAEMLSYFDSGRRTSPEEVAAAQQKLKAQQQERRARRRAARSI